MSTYRRPWLITIALLLLLLLVNCSSTIPRPVRAAVERYAGYHGFTIEDAWTKSCPGGIYWEVVVDWQDDDNPHTCTLIVRDVGGDWTVTDEECQGG